MYKLLGSVVLLALCSGVWAAGIDRDTERKIADAVRARFKADARFEILKENQAGAIKTYDIRIIKQRDDANACITEDGVFLLTGFPGNDTARNLPADVKELITGLSWAKPEDLGKYERTMYYVDVKLRNRIYRLQINPIGNLWDIQAMSELRSDDPSRWEQATQREVRDLEWRFREYFGNAKVKEVRRDPENPQFFFVEVLDDRGGETQVLMNTAYDIEWWRASVSSRQLPRVVEECVRHYFPEAQMLKAWRDQMTFYQLEERLRGGESLQLRITPKGDVIRVRNGEAEAFEGTVTRRDGRGPH